MNTPINTNGPAANAAPAPATTPAPAPAKTPAANAAPATAKTTGKTSARRATPGKTSAGKIKPATEIKERKSRVGPLMLKIVEVLQKGPKTVQDMAKDFKVSEREVRQGIDRARAKKHKILRVEKNTFGFAKPK